MQDGFTSYLHSNGLSCLNFGKLLMGKRERILTTIEQFRLLGKYETKNVLKLNLLGTSAEEKKKIMSPV